MILSSFVVRGYWQADRLLVLFDDGTLAVYVGERIPANVVAVEVDGEVIPRDEVFIARDNTPYRYRLTYEELETVYCEQYDYWVVTEARYLSRRVITEG